MKLSKYCRTCLSQPITVTPSVQECKYGRTGPSNFQSQPITVEEPQWRHHRRRRDVVHSFGNLTARFSIIINLIIIIIIAIKLTISGTVEEYVTL